MKKYRHILHQLPMQNIQTEKPYTNFLWKNTNRDKSWTRFPQKNTNTDKLWTNLPWKIETQTNLGPNSCAKYYSIITKHWHLITRVNICNLNATCFFSHIYVCCVLSNLNKQHIHQSFLLAHIHRSWTFTDKINFT